MELLIPPLVRQRALADGATGRTWLETLPDVVEGLAAKWRLTLGDAFSGGTASYVTSAIDDEGTSCVLKVAMAGAEEIASFRGATRTHELADGHGCARLLATDPEAPAMLLERLGPDLHQLELSVPEVLDAIVDTLQAFWRPVDHLAGLMSGPDKIVWLAEFLTTSWDELGRPCDRKVIDAALGFCGERTAAWDPAHAVLVHGDAHGWNTLAAGPGTFRFVDPEGLVSERAHDLAVPMREYNEPLLEGDTARLTRQRAEYLAGRCEVDPEAVWQWGFIERVSTGLANLSDFEDGSGLLFLEVAERCV